MPHPREKNCLEHTKLATYTNLMSKTSLGLEHITASYTNVTETTHQTSIEVPDQPSVSPLQGEHRCLAKRTTEASMASRLMLTHLLP
jgi:hypothetical protein